MADEYREWIKVDDLALRALRLSLWREERDTILERVTADYVTDIGAIGLLRQEWFATGSIDEVARTYWGSRREPESPRLESLLVQLLLNLAAAGIFEALRDLAKEPHHVAALLADRDLHIGMLSSINFNLEEA
jgi:hypothetical protein